jgi:hypothetical protein
MTLSTDVYVQGDVPARDVFEFVLAQMLKADVSRRTRADVVEHFTPTCFGTQLGQGLPAILSVDYKPDGVLRTATQAAEHEDCNVPGYEYYDADEPDCDGTGHEPACHLEVNLDTAYGYRSPDGYGCGDLHAVLVGTLGQWLDERSIPWAWKNEFTGEIHGGPGRLERLVDLVSGGFETAAWFRTTVLPAIRRGVAGGAL